MFFLTRILKDQIFIHTHNSQLEINIEGIEQLPVTAYISILHCVAI